MGWEADFADVGKGAAGVGVGVGAIAGPIMGWLAAKEQAAQQTAQVEMATSTRRYEIDANSNNLLLSLNAQTAAIQEGYDAQRFMIEQVTAQKKMDGLVALAAQLGLGDQAVAMNESNNGVILKQMELHYKDRAEQRSMGVVEEIDTSEFRV